jgi:hypothetical protein
MPCASGAEHAALASCVAIHGGGGVVMLIVTVVDLSAGPGVGFLPFVSLGPAFAGLIGGWRRTAAIGTVALALALCVALGLSVGQSFAVVEALQVDELDSAVLFGGVLEFVGESCAAEAHQSG